MKAKLKERKITDIEVGSAGIAALDDLTPTQETINVMTEKNIDVSAHQSRQLKKEMIENADLILAMSDIHKEEVLRKSPEAKGKVFLLKSYGVYSDESGMNIPDPIGKPMEAYEVCRNTIEEAVDRVMKKILP